MKLYFSGWDDCYIGYKAFAPFTKSFFKAGGKVILVMVIQGERTKETRDFEKKYLDMFKVPPSDSVSGEIDNVHTRVHFWTEEP